MGAVLELDYSRFRWASAKLVAIEPATSSVFVYTFDEKVIRVANRDVRRFLDEFEPLIEYDAFRYETTVTNPQNLCPVTWFTQQQREAK